MTGPEGTGGTAQDRALGFVQEVLGLAEPEGVMVNKFVILAEGMDSDGRRAFYSLTNPGATAWDMVGLLQYGLQRQQAREFVDDLGASGDGD